MIRLDANENKRQGLEWQHDEKLGGKAKKGSEKCDGSYADRPPTTDKKATYLQRREMKPSLRETSTSVRAGHITWASLVRGPRRQVRIEYAFECCSALIEMQLRSDIDEWAGTDEESDSSERKLAARRKDWMQAKFDGSEQTQLQQRHSACMIRPERQTTEKKRKEEKEDVEDVLIRSKHPSDLSKWRVRKSAANLESETK